MPAPATAALRFDVGAAMTDRGVIAPASILVEDGRITACDRPEAIGETPGAVRRQVEGVCALPGLVDLQVNGADGIDLAAADAGGWDRASGALVRRGVTAWCPTLVSLPRDAYPGALERMAAATRGPRLLGAHLEGPFLARSRRGAHQESALTAPDLEWATALVDGAPLPIAIWTLAPELPGALDLVRALRSLGVAVAVGHSDATFDQCLAAADAGATLITHLFNAMRPLHHREPGVAGVALLTDRFHAGLILDGVHLRDEIADWALDLLGDRAFAVSDATSGGLAGTAVDEAGGAVAIAGTGTLAGGRHDLAATFRRLVERRGIEAASRLTSTLPARAAGRDDLGRLAAGCHADILLAHPTTGEIAEILLGGEVVR